MVKSFLDNFDVLKADLKKQAEKKQGATDDRMWKPVLPKGESQVEYLIRFLPYDTGIGGFESGQPWIRRFVHFIRANPLDKQGPVMFQLCPNTFDMECPICNYARRLYNTGNPVDEKKAGAWYRKRRYAANILIIDDPVNPENNGKVFIYEFGTKIHDILVAAIKDDLCFFDWLEGRNMKLVLAEVGGFNNYGSSRFAVNNSAVADGDEEDIAKIADQRYDLMKIFCDINSLEDYSTIEQAFNAFIGISSAEANVQRKQDKQNQKDDDVVEILENELESLLTRTGDNTDDNKATEGISSEVESDEFDNNDDNDDNDDDNDNDDAFSMDIDALAAEIENIDLDD